MHFASNSYKISMDTALKLSGFDLIIIELSLQLVVNKVS